MNITALTATDAKLRFGALFFMDSRDRVTVTKNGQPRLAIVTADRMDELEQIEARAIEIQHDSVMPITVEGS